MNNIVLMIGGIGPLEIGIIALLIILLFGADKLPKLARSMGEAVNEFEEAKNKMNDNENKDEEKKNSSLELND